MSHTSFALCLLAVCLPLHTVQATNDVEILPDVVYGHKLGLALTMDVFRPATNANGAAIVHMASGAWFSKWSPPEGLLSYIQPLTDKGFTVFNVRHGSSPKFSMAEAIEDVQLSVRFIRLNAERFGIDPNRLGALGNSSGGHLALMLATAADAGNPEATDPVLRTSNRIQAVVAFVPPTDLRLMMWDAPEHSAGYKRFPALNLDTKTAEAVSPLLHVSPDDPPTLLIAGVKDQLVEVRHSRTMLAALEREGVPCRLIEFENSSHDLTEEDAPKAAEAMAAWFERYLSETPAPEDK